MARRDIELDLSRQHLLIFSAHLLVYLECRDIFREGPSIETVKYLASRVFPLCGKDQPRLLLVLTGIEARALKLVLRSLVQCYGAYPSSVNSARALRDLAMCQALLQRAKRHPVQKPKEVSHT